LALLCVAAGCGGGEDDRPAEPAAAAAAPLREQLGSLLVSSFDGTTLPGYMQRRLHAGETVGAVLFAPNVVDAGQTKSLTGEIQRAAGGDALVMVDQERSVRQLPFADTPDDLARAGVNVNLAP